VKEILAIIPVRGGSKRVKDKNIRPFCDTTLLDIKLETLQKVFGLTNILVTSDDQKMLSISKNHSVNTHLRDDYHASDKCTNSEFFYNLAEITEGFDNVLYSPVTCPLISVDTYRSALKEFETCDNLVSAKLVKHHLWWDYEGHKKPLNYDIKNSPNSQDLPNIVQITYGISLIKRELMLQYRNVVCPDPNFYILDEMESIDIDTEFDFMVAENIYSKLNKV